jgi:hypothetical protein
MDTTKSMRHTTPPICRTVPAGFILILMIAGFLTVTANMANAATYYLDAGVTISGDGKSWATAFKTIADDQNALNAEPNHGSGDIVEVNTGNYGSYTEADKTRTDWLIYKAAAGKTPVLEKIDISNIGKKNTYLKFDGFKIQAPDPNPMPDDDGNWHTNISNRMLTLYEANYINISDCNFVGCNKYLTAGQDVRFCDNFTYHHNEQQKTRSGILVNNSSAPQITNNYIHEMSEGSGIRVDIGCPDTVVAYNHVFGMYMNISETYFPWADANNYATNPTTANYHPGSMISIRSSPITIRNNVVHDGGSQLLMFYNEVTAGPYSDVLMENNLFYSGGFSDGVTSLYFTGRVAFYKLAPSAGHPIVIRNNTFVGRVEDSKITLAHLKDRYYGGTVYSYKPASGYDGTGLTVVNNILVGQWSHSTTPTSGGNGFPHPDDYANMTEGYNIAWYRSPAVGGSYLNNTIVFWYMGGKYHGYPCYFEDLGGSTPDTQEYDYSRDGVTQFFVAGGMYFGYAGGANAYADRIRDRAGLLDFHPAAGSPAIGSGYHLNQPSDSLGTIEPNGFIKDDGPARDASHHSIGCYEYVDACSAPTYTTYFPLSITKCTVTAGSKPNSDKISISGSMDATANDFNDVNSFGVVIDSNDIVLPCDQNFPISSNTFKIKNGTYSYSGTENKLRKSFTYNVKTHKFAFSANNVDLSGLGCPLTAELGIGDYNAIGDSNEVIVNGPMVPIPILLMMGVKNVLRVDKCTVKQNDKKSHSDQLSVKGAFAVEDTNANMTDRTSKNLVVTLDTQQFTIPKSNLKHSKVSFSCSRAKTTDPNATVAATFNFNSCAFTLTIKDVNIPVISGDANFSVSFADFNEVDLVTLP